MDKVPRLLILKEGIIIDQRPVRRPFFLLREMYPNLKGRAIVVGFIGPRGSGKSTGAARTLVLEYLLKRRNEWSNMPVAVDLVTMSGAV